MKFKKYRTVLMEPEFELNIDEKAFIYISTDEAKEIYEVLDAELHISTREELNYTIEELQDKIQELEEQLRSRQENCLIFEVREAL